MAASETAGEWDYRPHLDGVRALAVYLVVGFHAGMARLTGGFIGVDVFFVLSGYLVTALLLREIDGAGGRLRFTRFYARRARRLLPAAAVNLVATAIVFGGVGSVLRFDEAARAIRAAALYFANWHFVAESADYFGDDIEVSPVLHYWSLSVEEQFYLVWPVMLVGLVGASRTFGRHHRAMVRVVLALVAFASATFALRTVDTSLARAYYGTDARAYQLLAGALLALSPGLMVRLGRSVFRPFLHLLSLGALAGLVVLAWRFPGLDPIQRGLLTTLLTCSLLVSLESQGGGPARWVLSRPSVVYLGRISYGTYLWHWLVIVVLTLEADLAPVTTAVVAAVLATALAALSHELLEMPVRRSPRFEHRPAGPVLAGLAASILVGVVLAPSILHRAEGRRPDAAVVAAPAGGEVVPARAALQHAKTDRYQWASCEVGGPVLCPIHQGDGPRAVVVGESHAGMYTPLLGAIAREHDLDLRGGYLPYCPWVRGIRYGGAGPDCFDHQDVLYDELIPAFDPEIVFLAHRPVDDPQNSMDVVERDGGRMPGTSPEGIAAVDRRIRDLVADLRSAGRTVVVFEPVPVPPGGFSSLDCLARTGALEPCRYQASQGPLPEERVLRELDDGGLVVSLDLDGEICPHLPTCDPVVGGLVVWVDDNHLTVTFASSLVDAVVAALEADGVLGGDG